MLGAQAASGRLFLPDEDAPGHSATAVLSYGMWARRYGNDPRMLGKSITINGKTYEVVGILPKNFALPHEVLPTLDGPEQPDVFLPFPLEPNAAGVRTHEDFNIVGKLKPGVSVAQAQAEMDTLTARLRRDLSGIVSAEWRAHVWHSAAAGTSCWRCAAISPGAFQRSGIRSADRLCERGKPFAFARCGQAAGNRRAVGAGGKPLAHHSTVADRELAA